MARQRRGGTAAGVRPRRVELRSTFPAVLGLGVAPNNSRRSLRSLCSDTFGGSVHEAREYARRPPSFRSSAPHRSPTPGTTHHDARHRTLCSSSTPPLCLQRRSPATPLPRHKDRRQRDETHLGDPRGSGGRTRGSGRHGVCDVGRRRLARRPGSVVRRGAGRLQLEQPALARRARGSG